jgi:hypothetical protein
MPVVVTRNFPPLTELDLLTREDWRAVGHDQRERIIRRTKAGRDVDGRPFAPYSPSYAKQLAAEGMSTTPDLEVSGRMLQAITVQPDAEGVTLRIQ